ncbi:hypothetical protein L9G16_22320, partial [Shewanella sp. A25]|nr:hypothetical protein [Shewanella shenzhenensis]
MDIEASLGVHVCCNAVLSFGGREFMQNCVSFVLENIVMVDLVSILELYFEVFSWFLFCFDFEVLCFKSMF